MKTKTTIAGQAVVVRTEQDSLTGTWRYTVSKPAGAGEDGGFENQAAAVYAALNAVGARKGAGMWIGAGMIIVGAIVIGVML